MSDWPYDEHQVALRHVARVEDAMNGLDVEAALSHVNSAVDALAEVTRACVVIAREERPPITWTKLGTLTNLNPRTLARWFS